jgi:hypothetical protein
MNVGKEPTHLVGDSLRMGVGTEVRGTLNLTNSCIRKVIGYMLNGVAEPLTRPVSMKQQDGHRDFH